MATILGTVSELLAHVLAGHTRYATPVVAGVECADGKIRAQQGTSAGHALVEVSDGATAAKQDDILAALADSQPRNVAVYNSGTAAKSDGIRAALELSKQGGTFVDASARYFRALSLPSSAGAITAMTAPLGEGYCNGIAVDDDDTIVFVQPVERDWLIKEHDFATVTKWTLGAGWSAGTGKVTHTGGGGTATVAQVTATANPNDPILVGETYAVIAKVSGLTAGGVSVGLGTATGTSRTANGWFIELLTATVSGNPTLTPTNDFDGSVEFVYAIPATPKLKAGLVYPIAAHSIAAVSASSTPGTMTARRVTAYWHKRIGATELV